MTPPLTLAAYPNHNHHLTNPPKAFYQSMRKQSNSMAHSLPYSQSMRKQSTVDTPTDRLMRTIYQSVRKRSSQCAHRAGKESTTFYRCMCKQLQQSLKQQVAQYTFRAEVDTPTQQIMRAIRESSRKQSSQRSHNLQNKARTNSGRCAQSSTECAHSPTLPRCLEGTVTLRISVIIGIIRK